MIICTILPGEGAPHLRATFPFLSHCLFRLSLTLSLRSLKRVHVTCVTNGVLETLAHALENAYVEVVLLLLRRLVQYYIVIERQYICFSDFAALITLANG